MRSKRVRTHGGDRDRPDAGGFCEDEPPRLRRRFGRGRCGAGARARRPRVGPPAHSLRFRKRSGDHGRARSPPASGRRGLGLCGLAGRGDRGDALGRRDHARVGSGHSEFGMSFGAMRRPVSQPSRRISTRDSARPAATAQPITRLSARKRKSSSARSTSATSRPRRIGCNRSFPAPRSGSPDSAWADTSSWLP